MISVIGILGSVIIIPHLTAPLVMMEMPASQVALAAEEAVMVAHR